MYAGTGALGSLGAGQGLGSLTQLGTYAPSTIMKNIGTGVGRGTDWIQGLLGGDQTGNAITQSLTQDMGGINPTDYMAPKGAMGDVWNMPTGIPKAAGPMDYLQPGWELAQRAKDLPFLGDVGGSMDHMIPTKTEQIINTLKGC